MLDRIQARREDVHRIAKRNRAERLWVFGSCARKEEHAGSDIDIVAEFRPDTSLFTHVRFENELSKLFGCGVDVVSYGAIEPGSRFAQEFERERVAV